MSTKQAGRHGHEKSPLRRASQIVLVVGITAAVAAAFGTIWIVRAGIAVAVLAALLAIRYAWAELRQARTEHAREQVTQLRAHREQLSAARTQSAEVVSVLSAHNERADQRITELRATIGALRSELSTVRGDQVALSGQLAERDSRIAQLQRDLRTREAELTALHAEDEAAVLALPRHAIGDWDTLPSAADLWSDGNHPTVVDLQQLAFPALETGEIKKQA